MLDTILHAVGVVIICFAVGSWEIFPFLVCCQMQKLTDTLKRIADAIEKDK